MDICVNYADLNFISRANDWCTPVKTFPSNSIDSTDVKGELTLAAWIFRRSTNPSDYRGENAFFSRGACGSNNITVQRNHEKFHLLHL